MEHHRDLAATVRIGCQQADDDLHFGGLEEQEAAMDDRLGRLARLLIDLGPTKLVGAAGHAEVVSLGPIDPYAHDFVLGTLFRYQDDVFVVAASASTLTKSGFWWPRTPMEASGLLQPP